MNIQQAAQSALDVQNACNASGILKTLAGDVMQALWGESARLGKGGKLVNRSPILAMYLYKLGELNARDISSLNEGYEKTEAACRMLAKGMSYESVVDLDTGGLLGTHWDNPLMRLL